MIKRIKELLEKLAFYKNDSILWSPTRYEMRQELISTPEMRLIINPESQNYFLADASKIDHFNIMKEVGVSDSPNIQGWLYNDGLLIIRRNPLGYINGGDEKDMLNYIENTRFYKEAGSLIDKVEVQ